MEALFKKAIQGAMAARKPFGAVPWKLDAPWRQDYYAYDKATSAWTSKTPSPASAGINAAGDQRDEITSIRLFSWNIDFMLPFEEARMTKGLAYLADRLTAVTQPSPTRGLGAHLADRLTAVTQPSPTTAATASVIFLQECTASDLATIAATPWVQENFYLLDATTENWATAYYGTTTLVDRRLAVADVFRVHYEETGMDRDAFFVDVAVKTELGGGPDVVVRLCNTHLESLALDPPMRPAQMKLIAKYLHDDNVHAGVVAGDFNAIQEFDYTLHEAAGVNLKDAFLELGGKEHSEEGFTWGQQAATVLREQFGCSRMDKVYFCGGVQVPSLERFGQDVVLDGERESAKLLALGFEKAWITDHLGIQAHIKILPRARI